MLRHLCVCVCVPSMHSKVHTVLSCTHVLHYFSLYFQQFEFVQHFYILFFTCLFCPLSHILLLLQSVEIDTQGTMKTSERHEDERNSNQHKNKNIKNKNRSTMNNQYFKDFYVEKKIRGRTCDSFRASGFSPPNSCGTRLSSTY